MKLAIVIFSNSGDFSQALECIKRQAEKGFISGFDGNEDENFSYEITKIDNNKESLSYSASI